MELVSLAVEMVQEVAQTLAEQVASYRVGQTALRQLDRALWVVEKCARWAVPPPLDQDERPQPELVRPLPWVFFLTMLVALRLTRESISLVNLILGKPPLRSADVVMYIQSKRRYLRTLKYQGNRITRSRRTASEPWYSGLQQLLEFAMCFRRSSHYGNNNTTRVSNNDEVVVVKRAKRTRDASTPATEDTMERLIEKMMVDLDADSDDDSSFTLTNAASPESLRSENSDTELNDSQDITITASNNTSIDAENDENTNAQPQTPDENTEENKVPEKTETEIAKKADNEKDVQINKAALSEPTDLQKDNNMKPETEANKNEEKYSPKQETKNFIQNERCSPQKKQSKFGRKIASAFSKKFSKSEIDVEILANGRASSVPNKKKGMTNQRRDTDIPITRVAPSDEAF